MQWALSDLFCFLFLNKINELAEPNRKGQTAVHRHTRKTALGPRLQVKPEVTLAATTHTGWSPLCKQNDTATGNSEGGSESMTSVGKKNNLRGPGMLLPGATVRWFSGNECPMSGSVTCSGSLSKVSGL